MDAWSENFTLTDPPFDMFETVEIPLLGDVAAGTPYQAFSIDESLSVPGTLWGGKRVFALRVRGSSMIDEGIQNGDYLIVEPRTVAENGQTVVAEIDGGVTVKKYFRDTDGAVRLQPANPELLPLVVRGDRVRIIGIVSGIVRKFGFNAGQAPRPTPAARKPAAAHRSRQLPGPKVDEVSIDLDVNVLDAQLERWNAAIAHAQRDKRLRRHIGAMAELGRDLQTLREWCARTQKAGLRRALLAEANQVIRRMQRLATLTPVKLPDLVLH